MATICRIIQDEAGSGLHKIWRDPHFSGLLYGAALMLLILFCGTIGYKYIGGPSVAWIDSFYMTFITVATIGFGETVDLSHHPEGRLFTVFIAVVGIGTMSYLFSSLVALLVESDLNAALRKKRMEKQIAKLSGHYIVCGIGRVGTNVANELVKTRRELVVIESNRAVTGGDGRNLTVSPSVQLPDPAARLVARMASPGRRPKMEELPGV